MAAKIEFPSEIWEEVRPWIESMAARNLSPQTIRQCRKVLRMFAGEIVGGGVHRLRDVTPAHYETWVCSLISAGVKPSTCENRIRPVRWFFHWAEARGRVFADPTVGTSMVRFVRPMQYVPSEANMTALLGSVSLDGSHLERRDRAILEVAYATGFRLAELIRMNVDSVDLDLRLARILGKGAKERVVPLTVMATDALRRYLMQSRRILLGARHDDGAMWVQPAGGLRIGELTMQRMVRARGKAVGMRLSPQAIRRAFATHLLRHGASPYHLKKFLGHATFKHLKQYARYAPEDLKAIHARSRPSR